MLLEKETSKDIFVYRNIKETFHHLAFTKRKYFELNDKRIMPCSFLKMFEVEIKNEIPFIVKYLQIFLTNVNLCIYYSIFKMYE